MGYDFQLYEFDKYLNVVEAQDLCINPLIQEILRANRTLTARKTVREQALEILTEIDKELS